MTTTCAMQPATARHQLIRLALLIGLGLAAIYCAGCAVKPPSSAPAVSTSALSGHLCDAQQGVTASLAALSANDGKTAVILQGLDHWEQLK